MDVLAAACGLEPLIVSLQPRLEREATLPAELVRGLVDAGVFRTHAPRRIGGLEADVLTYFQVVERLSRVDASVGWLAMINCGNFFSWYPPSVSAELFHVAEPYAVASGNLAPKGRATPTAGGYRVSGRWSFVSGCPHADLVLLRSPVSDSDDVVTVFVPRGEFEIIPTWNGLGLRGSGSHDVALNDVFVPGSRCSHLEDHYPGALYKSWFFLLGHAAHACGIARSAIDALIALSRSGTSPRAGALATRPEVQMALAEAEATLGAARAYMWDVMSRAWEAACADALGDDLRMQLKPAMTYCVRSSARAVKLVYDAAGPPVVYEGSTLERCFRDIHTATQHSLMQTVHYQAMGNYLFTRDSAAQAQLPRRSFLI